MAWTELRGNGIVVRPWRENDFPAFSALHEDQDVRRWSPAFERTSPQELRAALTHETEVGPTGGPGGFAVTAAVDGVGDGAGAGAGAGVCVGAGAGAGVCVGAGQVLGEVSYRLDLPSPPFSIADVGYAVLPAARRQGVASTGLRLLTRWLLDPAGRHLARVQLDHAVENIGSCRTAARAGYVQEGVRAGYLPLRADADSPVVRHATCLHGITG